MKKEYVLLSQDGPHNNVIKFKPPMCFSRENVALVVHTLDIIFSEVENGVTDLIGINKNNSAPDPVDLEVVAPDADQPVLKRVRLMSGGGIDTSSLATREVNHF